MAAVAARCGDCRADRAPARLDSPAAAHVPGEPCAGALGRGAGHRGDCEAAAAGGSAARLLPREHQRLRELHAFLASGQADALSMDAIARQAGVNASTLQRQFRSVYGTTVFEFLRECRLQRARQALERDGITVGQAALLAGYTSAANFATAYRRRFGLAPKLARVRVYHSPSGF
ncbi:helix-turn-helix transcriptional regulator [Comamonas sp. JC664]|uniref:helix-turn-helix transcriptional regulator n=1 Tax=Comamonas sp. JC664 TaxID=2801917 RepID=UPI003623107F